MRTVFLTDARLQPAQETLAPELEARLPPGWGPGVKYVMEAWRQPLEVKAHVLPAPVVGGTMLHSTKRGWEPPPEKAQSIPIQVRGCNPTSLLDNSPSQPSFGSTHQAVWSSIVALTETCSTDIDINRW